MITNTAGIPNTPRSGTYVMTVRMVDGKVHPEDAPALDAVKLMVRRKNKQTAPERAAKLEHERAEARRTGWGRLYYESVSPSHFNADYVKLQGRLGKDNPNAVKYRGRRRHNSYQCIKLADAAFADVYIYNRR